MNLKVLNKALSLILFLIFLIFLIMVCCFGFKFNYADAKNSKQVFYESGNFIIFIGGAVEREGFYEVRYSTTYGELFSRAEILSDFSLKRFDYKEAINPYEEYIICNDYDFVNKNINYALKEDLMTCGIEEEKAVNIRNYILKNGYIKDKYDLVKNGLLTAEEYNLVKNKIYAYII